jgi:hypothetical protein
MDKKKRDIRTEQGIDSEDCILIPYGRATFYEVKGKYGDSDFDFASLGFLVCLLACLYCFAVPSREPCRLQARVS